MRVTLAILIVALSFATAPSAFAQQSSAPAPAALEPLPEAPPPPPEIANDPELEPQVTIVRRERDTVEEYRVGGRLIMIKVTPRIGRPYYLVAEGPNGTLVRHDSLDTNLRVPMWLLFTF